MPQGVDIKRTLALAVVLAFYANVPAFGQDAVPGEDNQPLPPLQTGAETAKDGNTNDNTNTAGANSANPTEKKDSEVLPAVITLTDKYHGVTNPDKNLDQVAKVGEKLEYALKWKGMPAGKAVMEIKRQRNLRGRLADEIELSYQTNNFVDAFYPVDSSVKSFVDVQSGASQMFKRKLREGRVKARKVDDRLEFDQQFAWPDGRVAPASVYSKEKNGKTDKNEPLPLPGNVQDSLSAIYYLRNFKFDKVGDSHKMLVGSRKRVDIVTMTASSFEQIEVPGVGKFDAVVVNPEGDQDAERSTLLSTEGDVDIWLEKNSGIPLKIEVGVASIGGVTVILTGAANSGLEQHDLSGGKTPAPAEDAQD